MSLVSSPFFLAVEIQDVPFRVKPSWVPGIFPVFINSIVADSGTALKSPPNSRGISNIILYSI